MQFISIASSQINFWLVMTRNLVSCPLGALTSPSSSESCLGSSASGQQKVKERAWRIGSGTPHPHLHSAGQHSITWPHLTARETGKCTLCHSNKLSGTKTPFLSSTFGFGFGSGQVMWRNTDFHLKNGGHSTCSFLSHRDLERYWDIKRS